MSAQLHRYWLRFAEGQAAGVGLRMGAGITAYSKEDAEALLAEALAPRVVPRIEAVTEDVALSDLDQDHVVPNMHPFVERGVWFPMVGPYS